MHKTFKRQLVRIFGSLEKVPPEYDEFVQIIDTTYKNFQSEYELMERSLDISSKELTTLNRKLQKEAEIIEQEVKLRTKELSIERSKLEIIAQNMMTGAILINDLGQVIFLNSPAEKFINYSDEDYTSVLDQLYTVYSDYPISESVRRGLQGEYVKINELQEGDAIFSITFQPLKNQFISSGVMVWINNITEEKLLERAKSELIVVASHQLRTPLTVTKGNTEILLDQSYGPVNDEQKKILDQTHESNENMITLVNQMLDSSKIEQGKFHFESSDVQLQHVLERCIKDLTPHAAERMVALSYSPPEQKLPLIRSDDTRLYQVFHNLIVNAIKYCRSEIQGCGVNIAVTLLDDHIVVTVKDKGIGIPKKEQSKIFGRFFRASNAETSFINGTGLGLHIAKTVVESMGGNIRFDSVENQGTIFTVTFPIIKNT
ncbi:MAG: two-component system sensor histidine kinase VicK [Candidatus Paceibacteria bacterium]|jgi:two-component system sensor histidine kinase VicK